jgi:dienelactone hydrolase
MYSPDGAHLREFNQRPKLAFDETKDFATQQKAIKKKLLELLGHSPKKVPLNPKIEYTENHGAYTEYRIAFDVEKDVQAICLLCIPNDGKEKHPLVICLQGHGTGKHISMGRAIYEGDHPDNGDRDVGLQALERGYAALCLDQRGMGERRTEMVWNRADKGVPRCHVTAMNALLIGRTMIGERCWDISRAIDLALTFPEIDGDKIICTGNSGGGTATFYAAAYDERIKVAMPSCAFCTFKDSIGAMNHGVCNFIPKIAEYMDMGDIAAAIAPRKLIVINGRKDGIFPDHGVREGFDTVKKVYKAAGVPENCIMTTGEGGHRYYKANAWEAFDKIVDWDK